MNRLINICGKNSGKEVERLLTIVLKNYRTVNKLTFF